MSFFDDASLVFLPSGEAGKDGKAYSMKPTNGDGDFTFSRGSNLTSTRIDSNGLIEKGRENLLLQSNQFDTTWTTSNSSVTSGQSGYDGSSDAWLLENTSTSFPRIEQAKSISGVVTCSIYAKAGTNNFLRPLQIGGSNAQAYFDLSNGTIANESNVIDAKIESVGSGWYRCSITFDGATTAVRIYSADAVGSFALGNTIIQSAQLEIGLVATEYIESGATTGLAGILEDSPRFDYSGGASCPSLLLEPSRTNLIEYSEYLVSINGGSVEYNSSISPEGLQNATKVIFGATTNDGATMNLSASCSGNTQYTWSAYVKNISGTGLFNIRIDTDTTTILVNQDIAATSEWTRVSHTFTTDASATSFGFNSRYRSSADGNEILIWGAQVEEASYPTSYIPNHSGGSVTREADSFEKTGLSSVIGQTEGTIFFEFEYSHHEINVPFFRVLENASNFYEIIALSGFKLRSRARIGGSIVANITTSSVVSEGTHKAAIIYKSRDYKFYLDGSLVGSSTESSIVSNPSEINYFDNNNNLKQFLIFPTALSDANCITLTS